MLYTSIAEEVLSLTFNGDSFPLSTGIPLEKIKLVDPKKVNLIKKVIRSEYIKLVILDGCLPLKTLMAASDAVKNIRRKKRLNIVICIVHQDQLLIKDTFWVQNPKETQEYLRRA